MFRIVLALAAFVGILTPVSAAPPTPKGDPDPKSLEIPSEELSKARELVQKLGSEAYNDREAAERELALMGRLARPALLNGVNVDPDPEIRARCSVLLPKANAEELQARLDAFMADTENKYEHDLPGWHKLRAVVRGEWKMFGWTFAARPNADKAARELFLEFIKAPGGPKLLAAFGGPVDELGRMIATRKQDLYNTRLARTPGIAARNPTAMEVALVVFAESQVNSRYIPRTTGTATTFIQVSGLTALVRGTDDRAHALQAVMNAWFDSRTDAMEQYTALVVANNMQNDPAAARLAGRLLSATGIQGFYKTQALSTLCRLKSLEQIPSLEKVFDDQTVVAATSKVVGGMVIRQNIELRDAALAVALLLTGQDPSDYGFEAFPKTVGSNFSPIWAKIPEDKRKDAFDKWTAWREKNP
jgi:hypothetical protein